MYNACMPNVQIRGVSDEVHQALVRKAEASGQSLQQFLSEQLAEIARTHTMAEVIDRIRSREPVRIEYDEVLDSLRTDRSSRAGC